jgi:hypothetical protein
MTSIDEKMADAVGRPGGARKQGVRSILKRVRDPGRTNSRDILGLPGPSFCPET